MKCSGGGALDLSKPTQTTFLTVAKNKQAVVSVTKKPKYVFYCATRGGDDAGSSGNAAYRVVAGCDVDRTYVFFKRDTSVHTLNFYDHFGTDAGFISVTDTQITTMSLSSSYTYYHMFLIY